MSRWIHRLSVDPETGVGECANCGAIQAKHRDGRWKCPVAAREQRGVRKPRTPDSRAREKRLRRERFLELAGGELVCQICRKDLDRDTARIDHDHAVCDHPPQGWVRYCATCIRGVLCQPCNTGLGHFRDSPENLRAAAQYLLDR